MRPFRLSILASTAMALTLASGANAQQRDGGIFTMPQSSAGRIPNLRPSIAPPTRQETGRQELAQQAVPSRRVVETTPSRVETAAPAPVPASGDPAVTDKLRELIANKPRLERLLPRKNERDAVVAFYEKTRSFAPLWTERGAETDRARAAVSHLRGVDADALDPADYPAPDFAAATPEAQAEAELKFTATLVTYARHASSGRMHWSRLSHDIDYKDTFDPADALARIANSTDLKRTLDGFNPPQPAYRALKAKYAEMRSAPAEDGPARIETGQVLKYARDKKGAETLMSDPRVPLVRERLRMAAEPGIVYNRPLADAVAGFQKSRGLVVNGQLNAATINALNPPNRERQIETIAANMERWRWLPRDLGRTHVVMNIPDFHLRVMDAGRQVWMTRVVVGKPTQATPLISDTMKFITVNPIWNVPQSIVYNELLPVYERGDRSIFERQGLKVEQRPDGIRVFQPPGDRNALGRLRFNFPNKFLVYMHDTSEKHYFAQERRAYSHGCMRVQDPVKYAEVMLSLALPRGGFTQEKVRSLFGSEEKDIQFPTPIPVHLTYQTAFVDDAGKLQFRDDIYSLDSKVNAVLTGSQRQTADVAVEREKDPNFKPTSEHRQRLQSAARGGSSSGSPFGLFDQLFRP